MDLESLNTQETGPESNLEWAQWMQWDGQDAAEASAHKGTDVRMNTSGLETPPHSTIQPSLLSATDTTSHKAFLDLPTPTHSSGSPESHTSNRRLSGETLRSETSPSTGSSASLKRKSPSADDLPSSLTAIAKKPPNKKRPHNVIEKRYRANLNDKIAELRDSVPSLRIAKKAVQDKEQDDSEEEDLEGISPSNKLNKASVLSKATEYIRHLELRNKKLDDENMSLKTRLRKLERELEQGGSNMSVRAHAQSSQSMPTIEDGTNSPGDAAAEEARKALYPPQGLIPVPEAMRKLRSVPQQAHYADIYDEALQGEKRGRRAWPTKFMLGSLAGLMVMEGFSSMETKSESTERGLFGIPLELLDGRAFLSTPGEFLRTFASYCRSGGIFPLLKGFFALTTVAFIVFIYLFNSKPRDTGKVKETLEPQSPPSLASPIEVRRRAWLTSIQTINVPRHSLIPEFFAVTIEWLQYCFRLVLGWPAYSWITGRTEDEEVARIKAWDIAIDAQLAGGDAEISRSRLVLTIFASGTLPRTPARLMLKALHCRVLLWHVGCRKRGLISSIANKAAEALASQQWRAAQQLQKSLPRSHPDTLPTHLASLLEHECSEIMLDAIIQRASNLMWDRPTDRATTREDALMDVVVEDFAIRAPLDAVAAWWSSNALRQALLSTFDTTSGGKRTFRFFLAAAFDSAPVASTARTRALVTDAVFSNSARSENIRAVLSALPPSKRNSTGSSLPTSPMPYLIDSSTPLSACNDISVALQCAMVMAMLQSGAKDNATTGKAADLFANLPVSSMDTGLLGFAPLYHVLQVIAQDDDLAGSSSYQQVIQSLQSWVHDNGADSKQLDKRLVDRIDLTCHTLRKTCIERRQSMVSNDTGYASSGETAEV